MSSNLECAVCGRTILAVTNEITGGYCRPCHKKIELKKRHSARLAAKQEYDKVPPPSELSEIASETARRLMVEPWFWSQSDDDSPFGSDTGADTLAFFREWRTTNRDLSPVAFLHSLFQRWEIKRDLDLKIAESELTARLEKEYFKILTGDDAIVATAFGQLVLDGGIESALRLSAMNALRRQILSEVVKFRGWANPNERYERVSRMIEVLDSCGAKN